MHTSHSAPALNFPFDALNVRVLMQDSEPWFVATDVCAALGIDNVSLAVNGNPSREDRGGLDDDEKGIYSVNTLGGSQELLCVNESGLYNLIFKSRRPSAKAFKKWVTSVVLPSIRKTGRFDARGEAGLPPLRTAAQTLSTQQASLELVRKVLDETSPVLRGVYYAHLEQCNTMLGLPTPALEDLVRAMPAVPKVVGDFWAGYELLQSSGVVLNHSRRRGLVALNLPEVLQAATKQGVAMPSHSDLKALKASKAPAFAGIKVVNSSIRRKPVWCWVFQEAPPPDEPQAVSSAVAVVEGGAQ